MLLALTRAVPPTIDRCELTHLARTPIDYARAVEQHESYERCLERLGCRVQRVADAPDLPDSVFIEDTAVVLDDLAVMARPGAESRRPELEAVAAALRPYRPLASIEPPGTLDGGDVLVMPGTIFVGVSGRTNEEGVRQLARVARPHGYEVVSVRVAECLHLKSAVTLLALPPSGGRATILVNPAWVDVAQFSGFGVIEIDPAEPFAANVLAVGAHVVCADEHPRTRRRLEARGIRTVTVPAGELAKAEGGVTCCSLMIPL